MSDLLGDVFAALGCPLSVGEVKHVVCLHVGESKWGLAECLARLSSVCGSRGYGRDFVPASIPVAMPSRT